MDNFDRLIAALADLADLDRRGARARLCLAAGGTQEEVDAIMQGEETSSGQLTSPPGLGS
ncbi:hypothetical protein [Streptosporangium sp. NPDC020145]|uniref:hypothetical protein n=1 Tax=Streptosporangium sp. NPDC020145 TaxID=3154694 RepID=UPI003430E421